VATVISELAERIDPEKLAAVAATVPLPWAQRLGFLLERVGASEKGVPLKAYVRVHAHDSATLLAKAPRNKAVRNEEWKLFINADVEPDL
jgi:hypothetical protein